MQHNGFIDEQRHKRLRAYTEMPQDAAEHCGRENNVLGGAYSYRQVAELIQNAADAIQQEDGSGGRIDLLLSGNRLYAANSGVPFSQEGIRSILNADLSPKGGNQIGRFGIGFKSLLKFGREVLVYSKTACFRFDPELCRKTIREYLSLPKEAPVPGMRLAWPLDAAAVRTDDPLMDDFAQWAASVIRADLVQDDDLTQISNDLKSFRAELLLFLSADVQLTLKADGINRVAQRQKQGDAYVLDDGNETSHWRLFEAEVTVTDDAAHRDATGLHDRSSIPITWAVPLCGKAKSDAGRFWVFFPTHTESRVPGILSAPWKVSSDRQNLMNGPFNRALLSETAHLIARSLPLLWQQDDPALLLDYLPRQPASETEVAAPLVKALWPLLAAQALVPNAAGELRKASDLRLHPTRDADLLQRWMQIATPQLKAIYVHPDCMKGDRHARLVELRKLAGKIADSSSDYSHWLGQLRCRNVDEVATLLGIAVDIGKNRKPHETKVQAYVFLQNEARDHWFALTHFVQADPPPGFHRLLDIYWNDDACRELLKKLDLAEWNDARWEKELKGAESQARYGPYERSEPDRWKAFWNLLAAAPQRLAHSFAKSYAHKLKALSCSGSVGGTGNLLFVGRCIDEARASNLGLAAFLIDCRFHAGHEALLREAGFSDVPSLKSQPIQWKPESWERSRHDSAYPRCRTSAAVEPKQLPSAFELLCVVTDMELKRRIANHIFFGAHAEPLKHSYMRSSGNLGGTIALPHPLSSRLWMLVTIDVAGAQVPIWLLHRMRASKSLNLLPDWEPIRTKLDHLAQGFGSETVPTSLEALQAISNPTKPHKPWVEQEAEIVGRFWQGLFALAALTSDVSARCVYEEATEHDQVPTAAKPYGQSAPLPLTQLLITSNPQLLELGLRTGLPCLLLAEHTVSAWQEHGAQRLDERASVPGVVEQVFLLEVMPQLRTVVREDYEDAAVLLSAGLHLRLDTATQNHACLVWQDELYLDVEALRQLPWEQRTRQLCAALQQRGWLKAGGSEWVIGQLRPLQLSEQEQSIAGAADLPERLLRAIGSQRAVLETLLKEMEQPLHSLSSLDNRQLAEVALCLHGASILQTLREALLANGLNPPARWGGDEARQFVSKLRFPAEFANSPSARREPELWVSGPVPLGPLHDYQEQAFNTLQQLWASDAPRRRAMVSLPTGAGKTRVAVEAAVGLILKPRMDSLVLWVVESDELCEQAMMSFRQVWANKGAACDLRVVRFWGGQRDPLPNDVLVPTVVVATYQTLNHRVDNDSVAWLRKPDLLVIDEAHRAVAASYTGILEWLNLDDSRHAPEPPVLALSATPFRRGDEESIELATRFDRRLIPAGDEQAQLQSRLVTDRVLAKAEFKPLPFPDRIEFTEREQQEIERFKGKGEVPASVLERLAANESRNRMIVEYLRRSSAGSIVLFAASVAHARQLAARLTMLGISASAISGDTTANSRQYFIQQFKQGKLRVLCNFGVLTTGFDAPKTDLILIARPVWSPVLFWQMVGRGLRGPKNGGTEHCEIATVLDNFVGYSGQSAADFFKDYYQGSERCV